MPQTSDNQPIGTRQAGFAEASHGPFRCGHCVHFDGSGACNSPQVIADPEVTKEQRRARVDADDCCNFFRNPKKKTLGQKFREGAA